MSEQTIHTVVKQDTLATTVEGTDTTVTTQAQPTSVVSPQGERITRVAYVGETGPQGLPGRDGTPGGSYIHTQNAPSAVWTIVHGLNFVPNVRVEDSSGNDVEGDVAVIDAQTLQVTFTSAFGGVAYLS